MNKNEIFGTSTFIGSAGPIANGPDYFMETNKVVLVCIGYRVGPFGLLSTGDAAIPGNFMLKDQALAIQWVYNYIAQFGGNRNSITW